MSRNKMDEFCDLFFGIRNIKKQGKQMNRKVIQDNKHAFDTYLETGKAWLKIGSSEWYLTENIGWDNPNCKYVSFDRYEDLRMAHADGKTVQVKRYGEWEDMPDPRFSCSLKEYRIKPDNKFIKTVSYFSEKTGRTYVTEQTEVEEKELSDKLLSSGNLCCEVIIGDL